MTWLDHLIDLLCRILKVLGGDCASLVEDSDAAVIIAEIEALYDPNNPPQPANNAQKTEWCQLFADTEAHLDLPGNNLPPALDATIRARIDALQTDIGC